MCWSPFGKGFGLSCKKQMLFIRFGNHKYVANKVALELKSKILFLKFKPEELCDIIPPCGQDGGQTRHNPFYRIFIGIRHQILSCHVIRMEDKIHSYSPL